MNFEENEVPVVAHAVLILVVKDNGGVPDRRVARTSPPAIVPGRVVPGRLSRDVGTQLRIGSGVIDVNMNAVDCRPFVSDGHGTAADRADEVRGR